MVPPRACALRIAVSSSSPKGNWTRTSSQTPRLYTASGWYSVTFAVAAPMRSPADVANRGDRALNVCA